VTRENIMPDPTDTAATTQASETQPGERVRLEFVLPDEADLGALLDAVAGMGGPSAVAEDASVASSAGSPDPAAHVAVERFEPCGPVAAAVALEFLSLGRADVYRAEVTRGIITYTLDVFIMSNMDGDPILVWLAVDGGLGPTGVYSANELHVSDEKISTLARCAAERFTARLHAHVEFEERLETHTSLPTAWDRLKGDLDAED